ncbi:hypothetical protein C0991_000461 [Blastosporella zonata]|nr:hypothetical protein C0991_000461 [Blastosporella zonata]
MRTHCAHEFLDLEIDFEAPPTFAQVSTPDQVSYACTTCPAVSSACSTSPFTSDASSCTSNATTPATSLASDLSLNPHHNHPPLPYTYRRVPSDTLTLTDALLWRPTNVLANTRPMKSFLNDVTYDANVVYGSSTSHARIVRGNSDAPRPKANAPLESINSVTSRLNQNKPLPTLHLNIDPKEENIQPPVVDKPKKKRGWGLIRQTISRILCPHPKLKNHYVSSRSLADASFPPVLKSSNKPYSASLCSKRSRRSAKCIAEYSFDGQQAIAKARKQHLRRSRSFSGYPNESILASIADECTSGLYVTPDCEEDDEEELEPEWSRETCELMYEVEKTWEFVPLDLDGQV